MLALLSGAILQPGGITSGLTDSERIVANPEAAFQVARDPPRAVDRCHPLMVRYDILSDEWESPHDRCRFSQDCPERGRVPSRGIAGL
jgi:hypothetical protein